MLKFNPPAPYHFGTGPAGPALYSVGQAGYLEFYNN